MQISVNFGAINQIDAMRNIILALALAAAGGADAQYTNPVLPGMHPDPSVTVTPEGDFWLVNSSFCFFPGVPLYHSRDLVNWEQRGYVLDRPGQVPLGGAGVWGGIYAPTIRYADGRFYMITTNVTGGGNFLVHTDDPSKGWSDPVWLKQGGIDPSLYFEDGRCWMVSNPDGMIWLCEIDPLTGDQLGEARPIWQGTGGRYPEGPHIYRKDGWYYLLMAEGGTEIAHKVTIARSRDISGPYQGNPANPILTHCSAEGASNIIQGTGHADLVQAPDGSWWMVCLAYRNQNGDHHLLGRETYLAPVRWDEGAWPVVNAGRPLEVEMTAPVLPAVAVRGESGRDDFDTDTLPLRYMWLRLPDMSAYTLRSGRLAMRPSRLGPDAGVDEGSPSMLLRRQTAIAFTAATEVTLEGTATGTEAGITVWANERSHYDVFVRQDGAGARSVVVRYRLSDIAHTAAEVPLEGWTGPVELRVSGNATKYEFGFRTGSGDYRSLASMTNRYLSTESAGGFTGTMLGLFASSPEERGEALFEYFEEIEE